MFFKMHSEPPDLRGEIELERLAGGLVSLVKVAEGGGQTVHLRGLGRERVGPDSGPGSSEYFNYRTPVE